MTWTLALEALGWLGSGVLVWSLLQSRILRLRLINTVGCLVLHGNETVGVGARRRRRRHRPGAAGPRAAEVPRLHSPPLMRGAYYDRVGFQPRGDHYVLEL